MSKLRIKNNEFGYLGNPSVKRDGVITDFNKEEVKEYQKCMQDPAYFARKYIKIISLDEGLIPFDLYPCNNIPFFSMFFLCMDFIEIIFFIFL